MSLKLIADENIPFLEPYEKQLGSVTRVPGRQICAAMLRNTDALLVRSVTKVDRSLLQDSAVRFVGTATIGIDHIDQDYLASRNIGFAAAPGCNAAAVVDYVLAALCLLRGTRWLKQTVGLVGCGHVGKQLATRLLHLGVECRVYDPLIDQSSVPGLCSLEEVMQADVISLHVPLTFAGPHATHHLLNEVWLTSLKPGCLLINTSRGSVIDNKALNQLLVQRKDLQVVLDVWENEPDILTELVSRVAVATPHIAGYSLEGKWRGTQTVVRAMQRYFHLEEKNEELFSALGRPELTLSNPSLAQAVLGCYAIQQDDARLRAVLASGEEKAAGFDRLRKEYPIRREFGSYQIHAAATCTKENRQQLLAAGFDSVQARSY